VAAREELEGRSVLRERLAEREEEVSLVVSWHLHLCSAAGADAAFGASLATSVRVRSFEVSARLPPRVMASRRDSTRSRLGFETRLPAEERWLLGADS
jgi:hypothetical protein